MDFSGLVENLSYINGSCDFWDNCDIDTFSLIWIHDFIKFFRNEITERLHVYWCMPGKDFMDVLFYTVNDAHILAITTIAKKYTNLCIFIDHTKFLEGLRDDVVINGPIFWSVRYVSSVTNLRALCLFFFVFGLGLVNVPFLGLFFISGEKGSKHAPWRRVQRQPLSRCGQRRRERCFRRQPPPPWKAQVSPQPARAASAGGVGERCGSGGCSIHAGGTSDSRPSKTGLLLARRALLHTWGLILSFGQKRAALLSQGWSNVGGLAAVASQSYSSLVKIIIKALLHTWGLILSFGQKRAALLSQGWSNVGGLAAVASQSYSSLVKIIIKKMMTSSCLLYATFQCGHHFIFQEKDH
nr:uncharacterized protein LOC127312783 [Lolium perenne]